jgi:carbon-monoxide dehydrogenase large subunit
MKPMKFGIGQAIKRVEDIRLVTGHGHYTADLELAGVRHAVFLRSPHACARFKIVDVERAKASPGVRAILSAEDVAHLGHLRCLAPLSNSADGQPMTLPPYPIMAKDEVRHVGDVVAMIVADTEAEAREALEAIEIEWDAMPATVTLEQAITKGTPAVWPHAKDNIAYDTHIGDKEKTDAIFAAADHVVRLKVVNNRLIANYMEPRGAVGEYDASDGHYTLTTGSQGVHGLRDQLAEAILKVPAEKVRVITHDVGGGFGTKSFMYREYPLVLEAARQLGHPVRWIADRSEHFIGDAQGRDNLTTAEMALDSHGRFLAMRVDIYGNLGGYLSQFAPYIPWLGASMATGPYDIRALYARVRGVYTHTVPVDAYRGAGRPEAAYVLERLVDTCARELKMPREAIRALNFVKPNQMPYKTQTDRTYDVGEFEGAMRASLAKAGYADFDARAAQSRQHGKLRGFGFSSYIECTAWGSGEEGSVALEKDGKFVVHIGTQSNGQGHETAYAQVVSQYLDVPLERIRVVQGDTQSVPTGNGTGGSRSIPVGAAMLNRAAEKLSIQLKDLAADHLEAAAGDLEISNGKIRIAGTDRSVSYAEIANLPKATPEKLTAIDSFTPPDATYPNGTHCCEVEIDPDTGVVDILRYSIVDDFGLTLNPLLLSGQVHGGIAQGIGQALLERTVFNEDGQLLSASFMDYCMPRADDIPEFHFETRNVPSTTNPLGLKGAGEAGSIGASPAVMNAVVDALHRAFGLRHIDMPATPAAIFAAIRAAGGHAVSSEPVQKAVAKKTTRVSKAQPVASKTKVAKKTATKKTATKKTATKKTAAKKTATKKTATKKTAGRKAAVGRPAAKKAGRPAAKKKALASARTVRKASKTTARKAAGKKSAKKALRTSASKTPNSRAKSLAKKSITKKSITKKSVAKKRMARTMPARKATRGKTRKK